MTQRGRPKTPGVLTPREREVLSLIKAGLSNREIAERLSISLAGAKFHVSEIIGKLGVSSREEAAGWEPKVERVLLPWRGFVPKALGAGVLTAAAVASFGFASLGWSHGVTHAFRGSSGRALVNATPTPEGALLQIPMVPQQMRTLQDATNLASFQPQLPVYVPTGYQVGSIEFLRFPTNPPGLREVHNDSITVFYHNATGNTLIVSQGFPAMPGSGQYAFTPASKKGIVDLEGREGHWIRGEAYPVSPKFVQGTGDDRIVVIPRLEKGGLLLSWDAGRYGEGWAKDPTNPDIKYAGSPFDYAIASDSLPLDELAKIALSVPFIADPFLVP